MVRVHLKPSRYLAAAFAVVHVAAAATLLPLDLHVAVKLALAMLVGVSLAHALRRHAFLRGTGAITAVEICDNTTGAALSRRAGWHDVRILGTSYVTPWLTVLNLARFGGRPRHVLIVPDNVDAEDFRRARVLLRWRRPQANANSDASSAGRGQA
jgi:toxin CptA